MEGGSRPVERDSVKTRADGLRRDVVPMVIQRRQKQKPMSFADKGTRALSVLLAVWLQATVAVAVVEGHQCMVCTAASDLN